MFNFFFQNCNTTICEITNKHPQIMYALNFSKRDSGLKLEAKRDLKFNKEIYREMFKKYASKELQSYN